MKGVSQGSANHSWLDERVPHAQLCRPVLTKVEQLLTDSGFPKCASRSARKPPHRSLGLLEAVGGVLRLRLGLRQLARQLVSLALQLSQRRPGLLQLPLQSVALAWHARGGRVAEGRMAKAA